MKALNVFTIKKYNHLCNKILLNKMISYNDNIKKILNIRGFLVDIVCNNYNTYKYLDYADENVKKITILCFGTGDAQIYRRLIKSL